MTKKLEITINQTWIPFPPYFPKLDELKKKKKVFFFWKSFKSMVSALDDSSLSSDQDTNQFLV